MMPGKPLAYETVDANGDDSDARPIRVSAERDVYHAGRDINIVGNRPGMGIRADEDTLAELVRRQAQEKRSRLIGTHAPGDDTANVEYAQIPGRFREADGQEVGDLRTVLEYYQSLSPRRLVIIGAPGAGKTVLLLELQIRLLNERELHPDAPVPVLVSASAYAAADKWEDWLAGQISLEFSFRKRKAAALVSGGRILPMVDGLDEMDPAGDSSPERAQALVRELNASMRGLKRAPVVVTCRPGEYGKIADYIDKARHVELSGLSGPEAAAYLRKQFHTQDERDRWTPVLETLEQEPDSPLTAELATPWKLTQALTAFRSEGNPAQVLRPAGITDGYSAYEDRLLFDGYLPSAVRLSQEGTRYTEPKVRRWLASLADGLDRQARHGRSAIDITLHEWRRPQEKLTAQIPYSALMLLPFLAASVTGTLTNDFTVANAAVISVFALSASGAFFPRTPSSQRISSRRKLLTRLGSGLTNGLAAGLAAGLMSGLAYGLTTGLVYGVAFGLAPGLVAALANRLTNGLTIGLATWLAYALAYGLAVGFMSGLVFGLTTGLTTGLASGITPGLAFGLVAGLVAGLTNRLTSFSPKARRPQTVVRTNGLIGFAGGIAIGLTTGLTTGLVAELTNKLAAELSTPLTVAGTNGLTTGLAYGLAVWLAICARTWIRYHFCAAWNALRGRSPLRFAKFLDWAVKAGLLRESGISYQFRHRQLQDRLASVPTTPRPRHPDRRVPQYDA
jgi:NACHT domain-containing protein